MVEPKTLLGAYCRLLMRVAGAGSVSVYAPAAEGGDVPALLLHEGPLPPPPELADLEAATGLERRARAGELEPPPETADYRLVPVAFDNVALDTGDRRAKSVDRRSGRGANGGAPGVWVGLRFAPGSTVEPDVDLTADGPLLGLVAALAEHSQRVVQLLKDPITGLPGRVEFQAELQRSLVRGRKTARPLALLMVNPDDFGSINERLGREAGDRAMREIASRLSSSVRRSDRIGRWGGAILGCLLLDVDHDQSRGVANKILRQLSEASFLDGSVRFGFSIGVAPFDGTEHGSPLDLIRRADQALNAAKRRGGSRACVWQSGSDVEEAGQLDRLTGIFTGNMAKDYRNMTLLWDSVRVVAAGLEYEELAARLVERLLATTNAERVGIVRRGQDGALRLIRGVSRVASEAGEPEDLHLAGDRLTLVENACTQGRALNQVVRPPEGEAHEGGEQRCLAVPLTSREEVVGCLYLEGPASRLVFDASDAVFLEALGSQIAVALDQARLAEQERTRQEHESEQLREELEDLRHALQSAKLLYCSSQMEELLATARRVAPTDATVLLTGESGTGKEVLARTLHELSARRKQPLVVVDCGAISSTLIDSELFGHEKGAFTGAQGRKIGRLAEADGATVLLDEIAELPLDVQTKLLRFVQEKQLTPVGGSRPRKVDVRIIAATNVDLSARVAAGSFRSDLYHRLNVMRLELPPLRERPDDILFLARHFVQSYAAMYRKAVRGITPQAEGLLVRYRWPGNVRELQNRIMQAVLLCDGSELGAQEFAELGRADPAPEPRPAAPTAQLERAATPPMADPAPAPPSDSPSVPAADLEEELRSALGHQIESATGDGRRRPFPLGKWVAEDLILEANDAAAGVARRAAALLGIPETTFRRRLRKAEDHAVNGLAPRPNTWEAVRGLLRRLVDDPAMQGRNLLELTERCILDEVLARYAEDRKVAAALLGVTEPTLLRRLA